MLVFSISETSGHNQDDHKCSVKIFQSKRFGYKISIALNISSYVLEDEEEEEEERNDFVI